MNKDIKQQLLFDKNIPDEQKQAMIAQRKMLGGIIKKDQPLHKNIISILIFIIVIPFILISELYEAICYYSPKFYNMIKRTINKTLQILMQCIQNIYNFIIFLIENRHQLYQSLKEFIISVLNVIRVFWYKIYSVLLKITDFRLIIQARIKKIYYFFYQIAIKPIYNFLNIVLSYIFNLIKTIIKKNMYYIKTFFKKIHRIISIILDKILNILEFIVIKVDYFSKKLQETVIYLYQFTTNSIKSFFNFILKQIYIPIKNSIIKTYRFLNNILIIKPIYFFNWVCNKISEYKQKIIAYLVKQIDRLILNITNLITKIRQNIYNFFFLLFKKIKYFGNYLWTNLVFKKNQIKELCILGFNKFIYYPIISFINVIINYSIQAKIYLINLITNCYNKVIQFLIKSIKIIKDKSIQMTLYLHNKCKQGLQIIYNKIISPLLQISKRIVEYLFGSIKTCMIYLWQTLVNTINQIKELCILGFTKFITLCTILLNYFVKASIFCFNQLTKYYLICKKFLIKSILFLADKISKIITLLINKIIDYFIIVLDNVILPQLIKIQQILIFIGTAIYNILVSLKLFMTAKLILLINNILKFLNYTLKITKKVYFKTKNLIIDCLIFLAIISKQFGLTVLNLCLKLLHYIKYRILRPKIGALKKLLIKITIYCLDLILRQLIYFQSIKQQLIKTLKSILYNITIRPLWWLLQLLWKIICVAVRFIKHFSIKVYSIIKKTQHLVVITSLQIKIVTLQLVKHFIIQIKAFYQKESEFYVIHIKPRIQQVFMISKEIIIYIITNYRKFMDQTKIVVKNYYEMITQQSKIIYGIFKSEFVRIAKQCNEFVQMLILNLKLLKTKIQLIVGTTIIFIKYQIQQIMAILKILKEQSQIYLIQMKNTISELIQTIKVQITQFYQLAKQNMIILRDLIQSFKNTIQQQFQKIKDSLINPIVESVKQQLIVIKLFIIQIKNNVKESIQNIQLQSRQLRQSMKQQLLEQKMMLRDKKNQLKADFREFKQSFKRV